jgi:hypothetical protein
MRNIAILSLATIVSILFLPLSYVFGQQQGFLFYENPDYNIKIQYPISNWTKNEDNLPASSPVYFATPTQYSFQTPNATMTIFVLPNDNNTVDGIVTSIKSAEQQRIQRDDIRV